MLALGPEPLHRGQKLNWNHPVALIGEKVSDPAIHFCELCDLPILVYGRMLPCKHVFCYDCAMKSERKCVRCNDPATRVERCELGQIFLCTYGAPKHSYKACRRTYLSQRDLQAHMNHRHSSKAGSGGTIPSTGAPPSAAAVIRPSHPQRQVPHAVQYGQPTATIAGQSSSGISASGAVQRIQTASSRGNLITIQLQSDHSSDQASASRGGTRRLNQR